MTTRIKARILAHVAPRSHVTSRALVAADLRLSPRTVQRHVDALVREGLLEEEDVRGDGYPSLSLSDEGRRELLDAINDPILRPFRRS